MKVGLGTNNKIIVISKQTYNALMEIEVDGKKSHVSQKFAENILVL
jgi:DtxR family Mn-dependent transcriptional regulator